MARDVEVRCGKCRKLKTLSEYSKDSNRKLGIDSYCKSCRRDVLRPLMKKVMRGRKEQAANSSRKQTLKMYGISLQDYENLLNKQYGLCAVCHMPPKYNRRLAVDHDHLTGKIRGLLCHNCNVALGHLKDNKDILKSAIEYLTKSA